jgi:colanic acid biosynthesis glycosyl transferase WcaI
MGAPAARVSELSRHWVAAGHDVTVLTGFPNHPDGVLRPEYRKAFRRGVFREKVDGINVVRSWLLPFPNRKAHERMLNYSSFSISAAIVGSFFERPDVVIATSPQILVGLPGWWIAKIKRVPFVFEVRDLWPESLAAVGMSNPLLNRVIGKIASFLYKRADHIAVVTPAFRDHLRRHWQVAAQNISVIQNGVETKLFSPDAEDANIRSKLNAGEKFVVSFIGTLGLAHGLDCLIAAAEQLQRSHPDILFLLVGEGADRERMLAQAKRKNLSNITFISQLPRETIPAYICTSDACLVLLKQSEVFKTVIPTKMLEFMSCGRPIILGVDGQARQILECSGGGIYIPPENARALCDAILSLRNQPQWCESMGRAGRAYVVANLSRERTARDYLDVLMQLTSAGIPAAHSTAA